MSQNRELDAQPTEPPKRSQSYLFKNACARDLSYYIPAPKPVLSTLLCDAGSGLCKPFFCFSGWPSVQFYQMAMPGGTRPREVRPCSPEFLACFPPRTSLPRGPPSSSHFWASVQASPHGATFQLCGAPSGFKSVPVPAVLDGGGSSYSPELLR